MSVHRQERAFRRKHKGPRTEMGEELYCETLGESFNLWVPRFPYLKNNGLFRPVLCSDRIKRIKSDNALKCFLRPTALYKCPLLLREAGAGRGWGRLRRSKSTGRF